MKIYVAMQDALLVLGHQGSHWQVDVKLDSLSISSAEAVAVREQRGMGYRVAVDPYQPTRLYCGTFGQGLWRSDDAGNNWEPVGKGITHEGITAVAVSQADRVGDYGVVWAGTEPSALFFPKTVAIHGQSVLPSWTFHQNPPGGFLLVLTPIMYAGFNLTFTSQTVSM